MVRLIFIFLFGSLISFSLLGQDDSTAGSWKVYPGKKVVSNIDSVKAGGETIFIHDPRIDHLVKKHQRISDSLKVIKGYRVQIFSTSGVKSGDKADEVKAAFIREYPAVNCHKVVELPNFKIRVGDFRTRLEALKFQNEIKEKFPHTYIVQDYIPLENLGFSKK